MEMKLIEKSVHFCDYTKIELHHLELIQRQDLLSKQRQLAVDSAVYRKRLLGLADDLDNIALHRFDPYSDKINLDEILGNLEGLSASLRKEAEAEAIRKGK